MTTLTTDLTNLTWHVRPQDQGQTIEVAYAFGGGRRAYKRVLDRSGGPGAEMIYIAEVSSWWAPSTGEHDLASGGVTRWIKWQRLHGATAGTSPVGG